MLSDERLFLGRLSSILIVHQIIEVGLREPIPIVSLALCQPRKIITGPRRLPIGLASGRDPVDREFSVLRLILVRRVDLPDARITLALLLM